MPSLRGRGDSRWRVFGANVPARDGVTGVFATAPRTIGFMTSIPWVVTDFEAGPRLVRGDTAAGPPLSAEAALERELIRRVQGGDNEAYDQLVRRHLARAYQVAYRITREKADAEDLVQDSFLAVLKHIDRFDLDRPFAPWLHRIIVNRGLSARRGTRRFDDASDPDIEPSRAPSPGAQAEHGEIRERFHAALEALPEKQRFAIQLHEVEGFTAEEIGAQLDVAAGTVRWYIHQARKTLREALGVFREERTDSHDQ